MLKTRGKRRAKKRLFSAGLILAVIAFLIVVRFVQEIGQERKPNDRFTIVRVLDGDTVELLGGDRLRLLAIDTPERGEDFYNEATELLRELTLGKIARIEFGNKRRDKYGRLLGYLYVDSVFVNKEIIENGLGYLYLFRDNDLESEQIRQLLSAQSEALSAEIGIWGVKRSPEAYYLATQSSFRFHRPGCRSISNPKPGKYRQFATREEGLRLGLSPCRNCKP